MKAIELAQSLAMALVKYKPKTHRNESPEKVYPSQTKKAKSLYHQMRRKRRHQTERMKIYGKVDVKNLFAKMAKRFDISESAARMRYYRGKK